MPTTAKSRAKTKVGKGSTGKSKGEIILSLLRRKDGATLADLVKATGWQPHSVRGYLSGQVGKKLGLKLESSKQDDRKRIYRILS